MKKELKEQVQKNLKEEALKSVEMTEQEQKDMAEVLDMVGKPIVLNDEDIKLGGQELDIRNLSEKNKDQLIFRLLATNTTLLHQLAQIEISTQRILLLVLTKIGKVDPKDLIKEIGDIIKTMEEEANKEVSKKTQA